MAMVAVPDAAKAGNWNVAMYADKYSVRVGETANLYAWNFWCQEPCDDGIVQAPYHILIYDQGTGGLVGSCTGTWECEVGVSQSETGDHVYIAYVAQYSATAPPPDIISASNPIKIGWYREASPCGEEHPGSIAYVPVYVESQSVSHVGVATPPGRGAVVCVGTEAVEGFLYEVELFASANDPSGPGVVVGPCLMSSGGNYQCQYYGVWTEDPSGNPGVIVSDPGWGCIGGPSGWFCLGQGVTTAGPDGTPYPVFCAWGPNVIPSGGCSALKVAVGAPPGSGPGAWVFTQTCWRDAGSQTWNCWDDPNHTGVSAGQQAPAGEVCEKAACAPGGVSSDGTTVYVADIAQPVGPADVHLEGDLPHQPLSTSGGAVRVETGITAHVTVPQANVDQDQRLCLTSNSTTLPCP